MKPSLSRAAVVALALGGCIEDLDPKDVVVSPRILDISADNPEINPGQSTTLRVLLAGTTGPARFRWFACVSQDATRPGNSLSNFGDSNTFDGCFGDAGPVLPLGTNPTAVFSARADALDNLEAAAMRFGARLPPEVIVALARDIGVVVGVAVVIEVDGVRLSGYKRIVVSRNPRPNTNPPPPRVKVNEQWITVPSREDGTCAPERGGTLRLPRNTRIEMSPDPDEQRWYERYRVLTASGQLVDRSETAFYSWYITGGRVSNWLTRSPTRDNVWATPAEAGDHSLWITVRDGHGGSSGCRLPVRVE